MPPLRTDRPLRVLALDPGERVGWAAATVGPDGEWTRVTHGITPLQDMAIAVHDALVPDPDYDVVIVEAWRLYPHMAQQFIGSAFPSVQFVGMVRLCCWLAPTVKLVTQGANIKKTADKTIPEPWRSLVMRSGAHDDLHDTDAIRHLHYWTWQNYDIRRTKEVAA